MRLIAQRRATIQEVPAVIRKYVLLAAAPALLALGLVGRSSTPDAETAESAPVEVLSGEDGIEEDQILEPELSEGLSDEEACTLMADRSGELLDTFDTADPNNDAQTVIDANIARLEIIKEAGEKAASPEFKELALETYERSMTSVEFDKRVQIDKDTTVDLDEAKAAVEAESESYGKLLELCSAPAQDGPQS